MKKLMVACFAVLLIFNFTGCQSAEYYVEDGYTLFQLDSSEYFIAYHEGWVYTIESDEENYNYNNGCIIMPFNIIYRIRPDGNDRQKIFDGATFGYPVFQDDRIYFLSYNDLSGYGKLCGMRLDGSEKTEYASGVSDFILNGKWLYYHNDNSDLCRIKTNGSGEKVLIQDCLEEIVIGGGYIFRTHLEYTGVSDYVSKIIRYNLDGSGEKTVLEYGNARLTLQFSDKKFLYFNVQLGNGDKFERIKFNGRGYQTVIEFEGYSLFNFYIKDDFIYYARKLPSGTGVPDKSEVYKIHADGTNRTEIRGAESYSVCIFDVVGDNVFYDTLQMSETDFIVQICRLYSGGERTFVYTSNNDKSQTYHGFFVHNHKLYVMVS